MLHLIIGTMKASKSSTLIDYTIMFNDKKYTIFYPACCDKKDGYVVSRDNNKEVKAIKIFEIKDMYNYIQNVDIIFIDEFQFLTNNNSKELMDFLEFCDRENKIVYLFGLSLNYMSEPFDITKDILPYADSVIVLTADCDICGKKATRCIRYIDGKLDSNPESNVLVMESSNVEYKSVCRECYRKITGLNAIK